jgi:predicted transcriptional regulator
LESSLARLDIVRKILETSRAQGGAEEPKLMYSSYLSYVQVDDYLPMMVGCGLLRYDRTSRKYTITAKGMDFLFAIKQMDYYMKSIEE